MLSNIIRIVFILFLSRFKFTSSQGIIQQALFLGDPESFNTTRDDCVWKRLNDYCPDPGIKMFIYPAGNQPKQKLNIDQSDWLRSSGWDPQKENIILVHGYAGGENSLPLAVLKDAYLKQGGYNVFIVDWGDLAKPPCYVAAVHNLKPVAKCLAEYLTFLRHSGLHTDKTSCVGHSLGAHICGLISNYINFRQEKIIGLDPARPLIKPGNLNRLDSGDAKAVHVIHTNAGYYGEGGKVGHVDFCVNGGKHQPYCDITTNPNLCSHIWSICYLAQSIFEDNQWYAEPCSRRCPAGIRRARQNYHLVRFVVRNAIPMGQHTPINANGAYCIKDSRQPFCPQRKNDIGDYRCCINDSSENLP